MFVEGGGFGKEFAVERFDGEDGEVGMGAVEVDEDAVCVLGVDFGEEGFSSGDFGFRVHVGGIVVATAVRRLWRGYRLDFVPTSLTNSSVKQFRRVTKPLIPWNEITFEGTVPLESLQEWTLSSSLPVIVAPLGPCTHVGGTPHRQHPTSPLCPRAY